jgi:acetyl-CoA C-acetyltransferase
MNKVYILKYKRTPIGGFLSNLSNLSAIDIGKIVVNKIIDNFDKTLIEKAYVGNVLSSGVGQNVGRQIMYECGINVPSITVNRVCSSGMQAIIEAYKTIKLGEKDCIIAGGVESMSNTPFLQNNIRKGNKYGNINVVDSMVHDGLTDPFSKKHMGEITEELCEKHEITREEQDTYAKTSYINARNANKNKCLEIEIVPVLVKNRKGELIINEDEEINKVDDLDSINQLRSVFKKNGTITAGNASKLSDGACFFILASEKFVKENHMTALAEILNYDLSVGLPENFPLVPIQSIENICKKENLDLNEIDYFEVNEAFAIAPIMVHKKLGIPYSKINIFGGAIAMGHPLGCSGARIVGTLINILKIKKKHIGCASICNGGGGATSLLIKTV